MKTARGVLRVGLVLGVCVGLVMCGGGEKESKSDSSDDGSDAGSSDDGGMNANGSNTNESSDEDSGASIDVPPDPCEDSRDCELGVCNTDESICVACLEDADCGDSAYCRRNACLPDRECDSDTDCKQFAQLCDKVASRCADCLEHSHCAETEFCDDAVCEPDICEPGTAICDGNAIATCNELGNGGVEPQECREGETCAVNEGTPMCVGADGKCQYQDVDLIWLLNASAGEDFPDYGLAIAEVHFDLDRAGVEPRTIVLSRPVDSCEENYEVCVSQPIAPAPCGTPEYLTGSGSFIHVGPTSADLDDLQGTAIAYGWSELLRSNSRKWILAVQAGVPSQGQVDQFLSDLDTLGISDGTWTFGGAYCAGDCEVESCTGGPRCRASGLLQTLEQQTGGVSIDHCTQGPQDVPDVFVPAILKQLASPGCEP